MHCNACNVSVNLDSFEINPLLTSEHRKQVVYWKTYLNILHAD